MARFRSVLVVAVAGGSLALGSVPASAQSNGVAEAQAKLAQAQAKLTALNDQAERAQGQLDQANRQLEKDQAAETAVDKQLQDIARYQYTQPALPMLVLRAGSISEAMADINQWRLVGGRQQALLGEQKKLRAKDQKARDDVTASLNAIKDAQAQAKQIADQAQANLNSAQAEEYQQLAAMAAATATPPAPVSGSSGPNHFSYGYCTWYVANRRYIPWFGNAIEWWPNARAYGYAEGQAPAVGAVMVTRESGSGHVAYVESVNPDGSWTVSEMNYVAWGVVSRRTIHYGQVPLVGFIYGKA